VKAIEAKKVVDDSDKKAVLLAKAKSKMTEALNKSAKKKPVIVNKPPIKSVTPLHSSNTTL